MTKKKSGAASKKPQQQQGKGSGVPSSSANGSLGSGGSTTSPRATSSPAVPPMAFNGSADECVCFDFALKVADVSILAVQRRDRALARHTLQPLRDLNRQNRQDPWSIRRTRTWSRKSRKISWRVQRRRRNKGMRCSRLGSTPRPLPCIPKPSVRCMCLVRLAFTDRIQSLIHWSLHISLIAQRLTWA